MSCSFQKTWFDILCKLLECSLLFWCVSTALFFYIEELEKKIALLSGAVVLFSCCICSLYYIGGNTTSQPVQLHLSASELLPPKLLWKTKTELFSTYNVSEEDIWINRGRTSERIWQETWTEKRYVKRETETQSEYMDLQFNLLTHIVYANDIMPAT